MCIFWTGFKVESFCLNSQRRTEEQSTERYFEKKRVFCHDTLTGDTRCLSFG